MLRRVLLLSVLFAAPGCGRVGFAADSTEGDSAGDLDSADPDAAIGPKTCAAPGFIACTQPGFIATFDGGSLNSGPLTPLSGAIFQARGAVSITAPGLDSDATLRAQRCSCSKA